MTTKQYTIPIEVIPEGWEPIAVRGAKKGEYFLDCEEEICLASNDFVAPVLILQKTKPREITLVETDEGRHTIAFHDDDGCLTYWRIKDEQ